MANVADRDAVGDLLEGLADEEDKPENLGRLGLCRRRYAEGTRARRGFAVVAKVPPVRNATGLFTKDRFSVDLATQSVTCPAGQRVAINPTRDGGGRASFKIHCKDCPLRKACTKSLFGTHHRHGRSRGPPPGGPSRAGNARSGKRVIEPIGPKVERKIAHFARRG